MTAKAHYVEVHDIDGTGKPRERMMVEENGVRFTQMEWYLLTEMRAMNRQMDRIEQRLSTVTQPPVIVERIRKGHRP